LYSIENSPYPAVKPLNSVANPNIYAKGTSAFIINKSPYVSVFVINPLLLEIAAITAEYSYLETTVYTSIIGSKITPCPLSKPCVKEYLVAVLKAYYDESTGCVYPSVSVYRTLTTWYPVRGPFSTHS